MLMKSRCIPSQIKRHDSYNPTNESHVTKLRQSPWLAGKYQLLAEELLALAEIVQELEESARMAPSVASSVTVRFDVTGAITLGANSDTSVSSMKSSTAAISVGGGAATGNLERAGAISVGSLAMAAPIATTGFLKHGGTCTGLDACNCQPTATGCNNNYRADGVFAPSWYPWNGATSEAEFWCAEDFTPTFD
jgi:hypothetical protein